VSEARLVAHVEVSALLRQTQAQGGFAVVLKKGEAEAGTILVVLTENGRNTRVFERMPQLDGSRKWHCAKAQDADKPQDFTDYLARRQRQDHDMWIIELDIANGERLIGLGADAG
jgi:hypothetical protein